MIGDDEPIGAVGFAQGRVLARHDPLYQHLHRGCVLELRHVVPGHAARTWRTDAWRRPTDDEEVTVELPLPASVDTDEAGETLLDAGVASEPDLDVPAFLRQQAE